MTGDTYFKKEIRFEHAGQSLQFRVSQDLFSSFDVDIGTRRLLRSLAGTDAGRSRRILDLGCGYGPIGLTLKKLDLGRSVHLVDRDALAVDYSRQNAELNGLPDVEVYGSLGYDDVSATDLDLIIANLPAKAGPPVVAHLLQEAVYYLRPGGMVAVVVVTALEDTVAEALADPGVEILLRKAWPGHTVFHYRFAFARDEADQPAESALERGLYDRGSMHTSFGGLGFPMRVAYDLPEFETLSYPSELLLDGMLRLGDAPIRRAVVFNPGQGHVPVALWKVFDPAIIALVDRDLLGLRCSRRNLLLNGCPADRITLSHQAGLFSQSEEQADLVAGLLREDEGPAAIAATIQQAAQQLAPAGILVVAASSTAATRAVRTIEAERVLKIKKRVRRRGQSLLVLRRG